MFENPRVTPLALMHYYAAIDEGDPQAERAYALDFRDVSEGDFDAYCYWLSRAAVHGSEIAKKECSKLNIKYNEVALKYSSDDSRGLSKPD